MAWQRVSWFGLPLVAGAAAAVVATHGSVLFVAASVGGLVASILLVRRPEHLPVFCFLLALPFSAPNIFGEDLTAIGLALMSFAGLGAALSDGSAVGTGRATRRVLILVPAFVGLSYVASLSSVVLSGSDSLGISVQGAVTVTTYVVASSLVLRDRARRRVALSAICAVVVAACGSYAITALLWAVGGVASFEVGSLPLGGFGMQPFFLPLTPSAGSLAPFGTTSFPRFTGIAREPGWMALYVAAVFFLIKFVSWARWWMRPVLLIGLLGTISTAGFGVFLVAYAYDALLRPRGTKAEPSERAFGFLRQAVGIGVMAGAVWLAIYAPGIGIADKPETNAESFDDRYSSSLGGIQAAFNLQLLGTGEGTSVTLLAAIASQGLLFAVMVLGIFLAPRFAHPNPSLTTAPILVIVLTLLVSQPVGDAAWIFVLSMIVYLAPIEFRNQGQTACGNRDRSQDPGRAAQ